MRDAQPTLSVMTFNVHMWRAIDHGDRNDARVRQLLTRALPDIVILNEVTPRPDPTHVLPPTHRHVAFAPLTGCSNLIASAMAPVQQWVEAIDDRRSFVGFGFETYCVFGTHLDVSDEGVRCRELELLHERLTHLAGGRPWLLAGDFNALRRDDYHDAEWQRIAEVRAHAGREMPAHAAVDFMLAHGYADAARQAHGCEPWHGRQTSVWTRFATCWAGTRIDYVWTSPGWAWPTRSAGVIADYCSDHFPVVVEFEW